jgi:hydrogenase expression/formation protein HypD
LQGVLRCVEQLESARHEVENAYTRAVPDNGNPAARRAIDEVFEVVARKWRGIGEIPDSGLGLRAEYAAMDAQQRFDLAGITAEEPAVCQAGAVLQGHIRPHECPAFGTECTPEHPLGAPMVSAEGACAAYYGYRRRAGNGG